MIDNAEIAHFDNDVINTAYVRWGHIFIFPKIEHSMERQRGL